MKTLKLILVITLLMSNSLLVVAQKMSKEEKFKAYQEAIEVIEKGNFTFIGDWAYPQKGGQVELASRPNYLKLEGSKASAEIPYFGQLTSGAGAYGGGGGGIKFDNDALDYSIKKNDKKRRVIINFKVRESTESYTCSMTVNNLKSVSLNISSITRQMIRYSGRVATE